MWGKAMGTVAYPEIDKRDGGGGGGVSFPAEVYTAT